LKYHKVLHVLLKFSQNRLKKILFSSRLKKAKKTPNGQIIFFLEICFKKGQMATLDRMRRTGEGCEKIGKSADVVYGQPKSGDFREECILVLLRAIQIIRDTFSALF
jgi:hypothetical protein